MGKFDELSSDLEDYRRQDVIGIHSFRKTNLITITTDKRGPYDEMKCECCGITAKRFGLMSSVLIEGLMNRKKALKALECDGSAVAKVNSIIDQEIEVIVVPRIQNAAFDMLKVGDQYKVIPSPAGEANKKLGVWIMTTEPIKLLTGEYKIVEDVKED